MRREMTGRVRMAENGAQLLARIEGRRSLRHIDRHIFPMNGGPVQGDVIEFHGVEGSGKTEMLYHLLSHCILPTHSGGLEVEVVFIDTDYHFDMLRLVSVLEACLSPSPPESETDVQVDTEVVRSSLGRLSVLHCSSSVQLLLTLHYLEGTLCTRPTLCLLVIDSISAFYWIDRASGGDSLARQEANMRKCTEILDKLRRDYGLVVFATTHAVMKNYSSGSTASGSSEPWKCSSDFDKQYLCRAWQKILTHRLLFSKSVQSSVPEENKQLFSVACNTVRTKGVHRCVFYVTEAGVQFTE
ncbi:DNA repair protein XRCC2 isoform X2 [Tachysurus fulvidraco]|nr:DNA repair protein XRCC2 isoform X2 [Tachysurus fulvidraco]XP_027023751.1 DNA repair protein XRCC2 isoform X2 [Tachysurus fulvidraco]